MKSLLLLTLFVICAAGKGQQLTNHITVNMMQPSCLDLIVSVNIADNKILPDKKMTLYKVESNNKIVIPFQIDGDQMIWMIEGPVDTGIIHYEIKYGEHITSPFMIEAVKHDGKLIIKADSMNLLCYQFEILYPPSGVDTAYKRSAFIHPVWTPHGQVLTRIQPPDHYHHYGIWNPWTRVLFEGDTIDFWNLGDKLGTVRFAGFKNIVSGPVFSEYEALHEHVVFKTNATETTALHELQKVRIYRPHHDYFIVDMTIHYRCASESSFRILEYRYAGLGWRATEKWNKDNSEVLTSEGKNRKDADGSLARWVMVQGELDDDFGGMVIMSHTSNYNHPEPLRIWPESMYDRGDVFASFTTTKNKDWLLEPGKTYTLQYRLIVYNGRMSPEKTEKAWSYYTSSPDFIKIQ
ncbi:MAG: hypothetical protein A2Y71_14100 [Bacteroidetes bacterium RBG_13_42_15]|nr:MAG: hypothetical protein A2Y71_14100 [Bacteroidetes bacterium RBG_13_42_15]